MREDMKGNSENTELTGNYEIKVGVVACVDMCLLFDQISGCLLAEI